VHPIDVPPSAPPKEANDQTEHSSTVPAVEVKGVRFLPIRSIRDPRGNLHAREVGSGLPFVPQRIFAVFDVPSEEIRGVHAHRTCEQMLICLRGSVTVVCDDGERRQEFVLDSPELGLYMPALTWGTQYRYSADAMLLVCASLAYDPKDYIRDYEQFLQIQRAKAGRP
jgi:UDP-2-acetamido-3-amino-2,3-dideoxy-glucuronate N-acetyltransferase